MAVRRNVNRGAMARLPQPCYNLRGFGSRWLDEMDAAFRDYAGYAATVLTLAGGTDYCLAILRDRENRPSRATWFIWAAANLLLTASYFAAGASQSGWMAAALSVECVVIAGLTIPFGVGGWNRRDLVCMAGAAASGAVWLLSGNAGIALCAFLAVDFFGAFATLDKSWREPESEPVRPWVLTVLACVANMATVDWATDSVFVLLFPAYMLVVNGTELALLFRRPAAA
ncbi:hypothetical protein [Zavarzinia sp.]|uniref:hypothetical protein n=1 Tax=Zavarzinia sp. TaxID=2027920 RepID=UPI0035652461